MNAARPFPKAFAIWFKDLDRWDPASFHGISWHWPKDIMSPIGSVLEPRKEKVDRSRFAFTDLQPITIHFDGSIDPRKVDGNKEYTMDLFFARPGDIIVAKIDLKNGAVGIIPKHLKNVVVTGHFAVYKPDTTKLLPEYLHRLIQTSFFKAYLWRNKVGAEGRKEVKLDFFNSIEIPLPPLTVQQAIIDRWQKAQQEIRSARERVNRHKAQIDAHFFKDLDLTPPIQKEQSKVFAVQWKDFHRWSVSYNQAAQLSTDLTKGKFAVAQLGSVLDLVQYGTSEKANVRGEGTPILRINNIKDGAIDLSDLKHIKLPREALQSLLLQDGDILIIRTSGSRDLVGTCAVFHADGEYVFASYLIRLRPDKSKADPDFIAWFLNSALGRQQIDAVSRQIMMNNINSEELRSLQIPLPPLDVQRSIVQQIMSGKAEMMRERAAAERMSYEAKTDMEALILGTKKLEGELDRVPRRSIHSPSSR